MFFCFFWNSVSCEKSALQVCQRTNVKGITRVSIGSVNTFIHCQRQCHTLPKAVSYTAEGSLSWGGECSEVTSHGPHPPYIVPWRVCPWVTILLVLKHYIDVHRQALQPTYRTKPVSYRRFLLIFLPNTLVDLNAILRSVMGGIFLPLWEHTDIMTSCNI